MLLKAMSKPSSIVLRVNTLKTTRDNLLLALEKNDIKAEPIALCPDGILCGGFDIGESSLYKEGFFSVQDTAAQICSRILNPQPEERVLDVCAAPGGKTCYMAELMKNTGYIEALDIYEHKKSLIDEQAKRLGISIIHSKVQDALSYQSKEVYDKVLVDAPCSGLGIIARKPEIKWNRTKKQIEDFSVIQYNILKNSSRFVKVGGELMYSTCTLTNQENEEVVNRFISESPNFEPCDISPFLPANLKEMQKNGMITLWPHKTGIDGFFIAKMKRVK
jgi:tRNA and rRNA cytosine-C5-methylases